MFSFVRTLLVSVGAFGVFFAALGQANFAHAAGRADFLSDEFYEDEEGHSPVGDPLEPLNRLVFDFNDKLYIWVMDPVASMYSRAVPQDLRSSFNNFFWNLEEPVRFLNAILQGRLGDSGKILFRFVVNSTLGVYGLGDPASREFSSPQVEATLSGTLARWGLGDGCYLVVPLYGPSTLRDFSGALVDGFGMTPYYTWTEEFSVKVGVYAGKETNALSMHLGEYEQLKNVLFDPYLSFRNGYFQHRREQPEFQGPAPE